MTYKITVYGDTYGEYDGELAFSVTPTILINALGLDLRYKGKFDFPQIFAATYNDCGELVCTFKTAKMKESQSFICRDGCVEMLSIQADSLDGITLRERKFKIGKSNLPKHKSQIGDWVCFSSVEELTWCESETRPEIADMRNCACIFTRGEESLACENHCGLVTWKRISKKEVDKILKKSA